MAQISRKHGNTRRILMRLLDENNKPVSLAGWSNFHLRVDQKEGSADSATRVMDVPGVVVDEAAGRFSFTPVGAEPVGQYYFDAAATDPNGKQAIVSSGRYIVLPSLFG